MIIRAANAQVLERVGAAVLVPDDACEADRLSNVLDRLLADPDHLKSMGEAAASVGRAGCCRCRSGRGGAVCQDRTCSRCRRW